MKKQTMSVAFSAVIAALSTVVMAMAGIVPTATVALPAFAGLCVIPVVYEFGVRWGFGVYAAVSVLSFLLVADREAALMYVVFFGYYPVLFAFFGRIRQQWLRVMIKVMVFNAAMAVETFAALFVLGIPYDALFFGGVWGLLVMLVLLNLLLFLYDYTIPGLIVMYGRRLHPVLSRIFRLSIYAVQRSSLCRFFLCADVKIHIISIVILLGVCYNILD